MDYLESVETPTFSRMRRELMQDDEFLALQLYLLEHHEDGDTISHTGGCKKLRWCRYGMGKRGGIRIIYYARALSGRLYLLLAYPKNAKDDISLEQKSVLKNAIQNMK